MDKYVVNLKDYGVAKVEASTRFDAVKKAAKELGCPPELPLVYLFAIASVKKVGGRGGGMHKGVEF